MSDPINHMDELELRIAVRELTEGNKSLKNQIDIWIDNDNEQSEEIKKLKADLAYMSRNRDYLKKKLADIGKHVEEVRIKNCYFNGTKQVCTPEHSCKHCSTAWKILKTLNGGEGTPHMPGNCWCGKHHDVRDVPKPEERRK